MPIYELAIAVKDEPEAHRHLAALPPPLVLVAVLGPAVVPHLAVTPHGHLREVFAVHFGLLSRGGGGGGLV